MKRILALLTIKPGYKQFAIPELKTVLAPTQIPFSTLFSQYQPLPPQQHLLNHHFFPTFPLITLAIPNFQKHKNYLQNVLQKTILVNKLLILISQGKSYDQLIKNTNENILNEECRNQNFFIACEFMSRQRSIAVEEKNEKISTVFEKMDIRGKVNLKNPQKRLCLIEQHKTCKNSLQLRSSETLQKVFFGVQLSSPSSVKSKFNAKYELSKRIYLGPTSTDNDLAFLMCWQGKVQSGSLVLDPFVGTGGLLIPPASQGALTFGCDLDIKVLQGWSVGRINKKSAFFYNENRENLNPKIFLNFDQYGLTKPCIFAMDSTQPSFRQSILFDTIITDPPYGLRASSKSGKKFTQQEDDEIQHIKRMRRIIFKSLLEIGKKYLKVGGRLVFLYPIYKKTESQKKEIQKKIEDFELIDMSENYLNKNVSRVLVTLEKKVNRNHENCDVC